MTECNDCKTMNCDKCAETEMDPERLYKENLELKNRIEVLEKAIKLVVSDLCDYRQQNQDGCSDCFMCKDCDVKTYVERAIEAIEVK